MLQPGAIIIAQILGWLYDLFDHHHWSVITRYSSSINQPWKIHLIFPIKFLQPIPDWSPLKIAETAASDWFWKGRIPPLQFWTNVTMHESSNVFPSFFLFFSLFSFLSYEFPFLSFSSPSVLSTFLDASPHLYNYMRVCPSVNPSVGPSVGWSVGPLVTHSYFSF